MVDAVIFSLRENGFLVYIPAYAIKGPVYLENKGKEVTAMVMKMMQTYCFQQVIYCGRLGPVWQRGLVTKKEAFVKVIKRRSFQCSLMHAVKSIVQVETIEGTNMYRLFDHVTVGVQLKGGDAHAYTLSFRWVLLYIY